MGQGHHDNRELTASPAFISAGSGFRDDEEISKPAVAVTSGAQIIGTGTLRRIPALFRSSR